MREEQNPNSVENYEPPKIDIAEARKQQEQIRDRLENEAAKAAEKHHSQNHEHIRNKIETKAEDTEEIKDRLINNLEDQKEPEYSYESADAVPRAVAQARHQLKPYEQKVSKFIHNSKVEAVSAVTGATVARPSGLLWGSAFSFIGTTAFYLTSLIFGYQYNAFVAISAFVGGFGLGLILEFLTRRLRANQAQ